MRLPDGHHSIHAHWWVKGDARGVVCHWCEIPLDLYEEEDDSDEDW